MKCHENVEGAEPKEVTCKKPDNEFCGYAEKGGKIARSCMGNKDEKGQEIVEGCVKTPEFEALGQKIPPVTGCYCKADNCNNDCSAGDKCTEVKPEVAIPGMPADMKISKCDSICKASGGDPGTDPKATQQSEDATGEPESGTGATAESGCQRITNSFEIFFLFWILASIVTFFGIY